MKEEKAEIIGLSILLLLIILLFFIATPGIHNLLLVGLMILIIIPLIQLIKYSKTKAKA